MIAEVATFVRRGGPRAPRESLLGIRWKCGCGVGFRFRQAHSMYIVKLPHTSLLMTFDVALQHCIVHTCGADVDAVPLWVRPEWG